MAADRGMAASIAGRHGGDDVRRTRLRQEPAGRIPFPVIVINDSPLKAIAENRHAVGQSTVESFMRITNLQVPGRRFVVVGYGWCGRGAAQYLRALGGKVAVVETDELRAFEAAFDGYRVAPLEEVAPWAEVIITATGRPDVVPAPIFDLLEDGTVLANIGHFAWEVDVPALEARPRASRPSARRSSGSSSRRPARRPPGPRPDAQPRGRAAQGQLDRLHGPGLHAPGPLARTGRLRRLHPRPRSPARSDDIERHIARRVLEVMGASR
jgi:adenosylhomocysteinase